MTKLIVAFRNFVNIPKNMPGKISDFSLSRIMKEFGVATTIIIIIIIVLCFCYRYLDYAGLLTF
jgi:cell division protein FtsW (lipid II flippase)